MQLDQNQPGYGRSPIGLSIAVCVALVSWPAEPLSGEELLGFTEPSRVIKAATDQVGIIDKVLVEEGQMVKAGQPLAELNRDVHEALLAVSEYRKNSEGQLRAASAELKMYRDRLQKYETLRKDGFAQQIEVERAATDSEVADAKLQLAREEKRTRELEFESNRIQLSNRIIRSPIDGAIVELLKDEGEFVANHSPELLVIVDLDPLLAVVTIPSSMAVRMSKGERVPVHFQATGQTAVGVVSVISPVTDPESGTVRVKLKIANRDGVYRSGERITINLEAPKGPLANR